MSTLKTTNIAHPSATGTNIVLNSDDSTTLGTAKLTTLADSAGSNASTPAAIANGIAKAWVNFNGTGTVAIRASYNVSSITDNGVGQYRINFTNALPDANFSATMTAGDFAAVVAYYQPVTQNFNASYVETIVTNSAASGTLDPSAVSFAIFR